MTNLKEVLDKSYQITPLQNKILKLVEETGEFSRIYLKTSNSVNSSEGLKDSDKEELKQELIEEAVDIYLCVIDILNHVKEDLNLTDEEVDTIINKKVNKWARKLK